MNSLKICYHYDRGYCKKNKNCPNKHYEETCEKRDCERNNCLKRHPIICKYFYEREFCKFGSYCKYLHKRSSNCLETKIINDKLKDIKEENDARERRSQEQFNSFQRDLEMKYEQFKLNFDEVIEKTNGYKKDINILEQKISILRKDYESLDQICQDKTFQLQNLLDKIGDNPNNFEGNDISENSEESEEPENETACENCNKMFIIKEEIDEIMCDNCVFVIAERENIILPRKYQCDVCHAKI